MPCLCCYFPLWLLVYLIQLTSATSDNTRITSFNGRPTDLIYTFTSDAYMRVEANSLWPFTLQRAISFQFKTKEANGLLMYHTLESAPKGFPVYEFYIVLENGKLKILHEFGGGLLGEEVNEIGKNLDQDEWHRVRIEIDPSNGSLTARIDEKANFRFYLQSLIDKPRNWNESSSSPALLYFGGLDPNKKIAHQQYGVTRFIGCLGNITSHYANQTHIGRILHSSGLNETCVNLCHGANLCRNGVPCVNHYSHYTCDCFGTTFEGPYCSSFSVRSQTFRGYSYISYKVYDWQNRVESSSHRVCMHFKTKFRNSVLMYGYGISPKRNYFLFFLYNGTLHFEVDFGAERLRASLGNNRLADNRWHNVTLIHKDATIYLQVDEQKADLTVKGNDFSLHTDPHIYIGGLPNATFSKLSETKLDKYHKFIGCLRFVYFNRNNILYDLQTGNTDANYYSILPPEYSCNSVNTIPITYQTSDSHIIVNGVSLRTLFLNFEFKTEQATAILSSGTLEAKSGQVLHWILHMIDKRPIFSVLAENETMIWSIKQNYAYPSHDWQHIGVYVKPTGEVTLVCKHRNPVSGRFPRQITKIGPIMMGALDLSQFGTNFTRFGEGIVGCIQDIWVNNRLVDVRDVLSNDSLKHGKFSIDSCSLVNPCNNPSICEHGGRCVLKANAMTECDCSSTGYTGKTCHFSLHKRTCEELYRSGYQESGTYMIDIDRNGPFPPAYVECSMSDTITETVVRNNFPLEMTIRRKGMSNFYVDIRYRDFTQRMLAGLIEHSDRCEQLINYHCKNAPFGLAELTWMKSVTAGKVVNHVGSQIPGRCACSISKSCLDREKYCNCDSASESWQTDSGTLTEKPFVGISRVYVLQPNMSAYSEGRLTIGSVKCEDSYTQKYVITFKTKESYLKIPGWKRGDMSFSFRTSASEAIILYQSALLPHHGYFKIILISGHVMHFKYTVNGIARTTELISRRQLNSGEWQQVWIDYDRHHMRFTVNLDSIMVDLEYDEEFGVFEGALYVGGAPRNILRDDRVKNGFIGCLKGVVIGDKVLDLNRHFSKKSLEVVPGCKPSCEPNPCQNGATCIDHWGSYQCVCSNPTAHKGVNCEINYNSDAITFSKPKSYVYQVLDANSTILTANEILLSFRTHSKEALIFYVVDPNNNFIQIHTTEGENVHLTLNSGSEIVSSSINIGDRLTSGDYMQVNIGRSNNSTVFMVNGSAAQIEKATILLDNYIQTPWTIGEELELVKPTRNYFPPIPQIHLFLGGVDEDNARTRLPHLIGCIAGLVIDGNQWSLNSLAENATSNGGVKPGCKMQCDSRPCKNGGQCIEDWEHGTTACECRYTSFGGERCDEDVGALLNGFSSIKYTFVTPKFYYGQSVFIRFAYTADERALQGGKGTNRLLLAITFENGNHFVLVALLARNALFFQETYNNKIYSMTVLHHNTLSDGWRHSVSYSRSTSVAYLSVDGLTYSIAPHFIRSLTRTTSANVVTIGGKVNRRDERFSNFENFDGCISNINVTLGDVTMLPLVSMFSGANLSQIKVEGEIEQKKCGPFKPVSSSSKAANPLPKIGAEKWKPDPPKKINYLDKSNASLMKKKSYFQLYLLIICVTFLLTVFGSVGAYMVKLQRSYELMKFRGETPFFNSKRNMPSSMRNGFPTRENHASVRLLRFNTEVQQRFIQPLPEEDEEFDDESS